MKSAALRDRALVAVVMLATLDGCQLVKKLTGRGGNDAGTTTTTPILSDAGGGPSPVIALPNPTVSPLPTQPVAIPVPDAAPPTPPAVDDAGAAPTAVADAGAPANNGIAVVDAGAGTAQVGGRTGHRIDNFCKEHPGSVHPRTHVLCPS